MNHSVRQYYFRMQGKVEGPFDLARAQSLVRRGRLSRYHEVSIDRVHWHRATEFPELFVARVEQKTRGMLVEEKDPSPTVHPQESAPAERLWYYSTGNQEQGPVPMSQLANLIRSGQLDKDALVWTEGMEQWTPWRNVPALRAFQEPTVSAQTSDAKESKESSEKSESRPKVSGMALTSLVLGSVFWGVLLVFLGALAIPWATFGLVLLISSTVGFVVAVVMAHLALADLRQRREVAGRGVGIMGLVMGYAGMTVILIFFVMLLVGTTLLVNLGRLTR